LIFRGGTDTSLAWLDALLFIPVFTEFRAIRSGRRPDALPETTAGPGSRGTGPAADQFTAIRRGKDSLGFGRVNVSTPSSTRAVIAS
jgi:hypothetical protein